MDNNGAWRRCVSCGKFMSYAELESAVPHDLITMPHHLYPSDEVAYEHLTCNATAKAALTMDEEGK